MFRDCICSLYWMICFCKEVWFLHPCLTSSSRAFRSLVHMTFAPSCFSLRSCISVRHWLAPFISGEVAHTTIMIREMMDHRARQAITILLVVREDLESVILRHADWRCPRRTGCWVRVCRDERLSSKWNETFKAWVSPPSSAQERGVALLLWWDLPSSSSAL